MMNNLMQLGMFEQTSEVPDESKVKKAQRDRVKSAGATRPAQYKYKTARNHPGVSHLQ